MAEEVEQESTGKSFKGVIITLVSTVTLGVGGFITNKLTGGGDEEKTPTQQAAPVININNTQTQQQAASSGGKTVIIKEKETVKEKPVPAKPKKEADEFKEKPAQW
jgi:Flp pilus assembly protein TadD